MANELQNDEVGGRLTSYSNSETTSTLSELGASLVAEALSRVDKLDSKAGATAGYAGAVIGLLVTTEHDWSKNLGLWAKLVTLSAVLITLVAALMAIVALKPAPFTWVSDEEWLCKELLADPEQLRKYYIKVLHGVISSHRQRSAQKAALIQCAQYLLLLAGLLLVFSFTDEILGQIFICS